MSFNDRVDAGRQLAPLLMHLRGEDVVVLALPRGGGVPVAFEVAQALDAQLDAVVVRKLGAPLQPELAMGAVAEDDVLVVDPGAVQRAHVSETELGAVIRRERAELRRQVELLRADRLRVPLTGRTVIVVDDGIATGSTVRAACRLVRRQQPRRLVLAAPVCAADTALKLRHKVDEVQCVELPDWLCGVGQFYRHFEQVCDDDVTALLRSARSAAPIRSPDLNAGPRVRDEHVEVLAPGQPPLPGHLVVPQRAQGLVIVGNGSGSSRNGPRNRYLAAILNGQRLATLLLDLLTPDEALHRPNVFNIELLAARLTGAVAWARQDCRGLPVGLFGTSTGAAAALRAAAAPEIAAVVVAGGRPDLAGPLLGLVHAPILLIVGAHDDGLLELNRRALPAMRCDSRLSVVPGARWLFEDLDTLEQTADLAADWFLGHLPVGGGQLVSESGRP